MLHLAVAFYSLFIVIQILSKHKLFSGPVRGLSYFSNMPNNRHYLVVVGEDVNKMGVDGISTYIKIYSNSDMNRPASGNIYFSFLKKAMYCLICFARLNIYFFDFFIIVIVMNVSSPMGNDDQVTAFCTISDASQIAVGFGSGAILLYENVSLMDSSNGRCLFS